MGDFTCYSGLSLILIDCILCSISLRPLAVDHGVLELVGSDHSPMIIKLRSCIQLCERARGCLHVRKGSLN